MRALIYTCGVGGMVLHPHIHPHVSTVHPSVRPSAHPSIQEAREVPVARIWTDEKTAHLSIPEPRASLMVWGDHGATTNGRDPLAGVIGRRGYRHVQDSAPGNVTLSGLQNPGHRGRSCGERGNDPFSSPPTSSPLSLSLASSFIHSPTMASNVHLIGPPKLEILGPISFPSPSTYVGLIRCVVSYSPTSTA